jgi:hypothetical protein
LQTQLEGLLARAKKTAPVPPCAKWQDAIAAADLLDVQVKQAFDGVTLAAEAGSKIDSANFGEFATRTLIAAGQLGVLLATLPTAELRFGVQPGTPSAIVDTLTSAEKTIAGQAAALAGIGAQVVQNLRIGSLDAIDATLNTFAATVSRFDVALAELKIHEAELVATGRAALGTLVGIAGAAKAFYDAQEAADQYWKDADSNEQRFDLAESRYEAFLVKLKLAVLQIQAAQADCPSKPKTATPTPATSTQTPTQPPPPMSTGQPPGSSRLVPTSATMSVEPTMVGQSCYVWVYAIVAPVVGATSYTVTFSQAYNSAWGGIPGKTYTGTDTSTATKIPFTDTILGGQPCTSPNGVKFKAAYEQSERINKVVATVPR